MLVPVYVIFFDGQCPVCIRSRQAVQRLKADADLRFVDINDPDNLRRFPMVDAQEAHQQLFVLDPHGYLAGGYDGVVSLTRAIPGLRFLEPLLRWSPLRRLGWRIYRWVARNRYSLSRSLPQSHPGCKV